jgi:large subunit ribosomal protein L10
VNRDEKVAAIERMQANFEQTPHVILTTFRGLSVNQANELRQKIDGAGGRYEVIKNRLAKRAAKGTSAEPLTQSLNGPCAVAMHDTDPVGLAKALSEFAKDNPQIQMLAAVVDAKDVIDAEGVKQLAKLPGLLELRAQLLALIQTPATSLVRLLNTPGGQVARVIDARRDALGEAGAD